MNHVLHILILMNHITIESGVSTKFFFDLNCFFGKQLNWMNHVLHILILMNHIPTESPWMNHVPLNRILILETTTHLPHRWWEVGGEIDLTGSDSHLPTEGTLSDSFLQTLSQTDPCQTRRFLHTSMDYNTPLS